MSVNTTPSITKSSVFDSYVQPISRWLTKDKIAAFVKALGIFVCIAAACYLTYQLVLKFRKVKRQQPPLNPNKGNTLPHTAPIKADEMNLARTQARLKKSEAHLKRIQNISLHITQDFNQDRKSTDSDTLKTEFAALISKEAKIAQTEIATGNLKDTEMENVVKLFHTKACKLLFSAKQHSTTPSVPQNQLNLAAVWTSQVLKYIHDGKRCPKEDLPPLIQQFNLFLSKSRGLINKPVFKAPLEQASTSLTPRAGRQAGLTAIQFLALNGGPDKFVQSLATYKCNVNVKDSSGLTPLMASIAAGHLDISETLVNIGEDCNLQVNQRGGRFDNTALHLLCIQSNNNSSPTNRAKTRKIAEALISRGSSIDDKNGHGQTTAHLAGLVRDNNFLTIGRTYHANFQIRNVQNQTPCELANLPYDAVIRIIASTVTTHLIINPEEHHNRAKETTQFFRELT